MYDSAKRSTNAKKNGLGTNLKGKTYEEIYGPEKAAQLKAKRSASRSFQSYYDRATGSSYEEIYGEVKAQELRQNRREARTGERNNWWRGGITIEGIGYRGEDWLECRKKALIRDDYTCQDCGVKDVKLDVHHKIPWHVTHDNSLENLITLCSSCHKKVDLLYIEENGHYPIMGVVISQEETRIKLRESQLRRWQDPERRKQASERMIGNNFSPKNLPRNPNGTFARS